MKQRLACGVGGPGGLQGCQLGQAGTRPRVDAVISGSPGQGPPFGEVSSQVLGDGGHRHRGRVRAAATWSSVASTASSSPSCHGSAGLPACHVVGDEREPWPGLGCPVQARRRQPPGSDQRIQPGEHARLLAVQPGGVEVDLARCRLGEPRGPVRAADRAAIPRAEAARLVPGLDYRGTADLPDGRAHWLRNIPPGNPGSLGRRRAHHSSVRLPAIRWTHFSARAADADSAEVRGPPPTQSYGARGLVAQGLVPPGGGLSRVGQPWGWVKCRVPLGSPVTVQPSR